MKKLLDTALAIVVGLAILVGAYYLALWAGIELG